MPPERRMSPRKRFGINYTDDKNADLRKNVNGDCSRSQFVGESEKEIGLKESTKCDVSIEIQPNNKVRECKYKTAKMITKPCIIPTAVKRRKKLARAIVDDSSLLNSGNFSLVTEPAELENVSEKKVASKKRFSKKAEQLDVFVKAQNLDSKSRQHNIPIADEHHTYTLGNSYNARAIKLNDKDTSIEETCSTIPKLIYNTRRKSLRSPLESKVISVSENRATNPKTCKTFKRFKKLKLDCKDAQNGENLANVASADTQSNSVLPITFEPIKSHKNSTGGKHLTVQPSCIITRLTCNLENPFSSESCVTKDKVMPRKCKRKKFFDETTKKSCLSNPENASRFQSFNLCKVVPLKEINTASEGEITNHSGNSEHMTESTASIQEMEKPLFFTTLDLVNNNESLLKTSQIFDYENKMSCISLDASCRKKSQIQDKNKNNTNMSQSLNVEATYDVQVPIEEVLTSVGTSSVDPTIATVRKAVTTKRKLLKRSAKSRSIIDGHLTNCKNCRINKNHKKSKIGVTMELTNETTIITNHDEDVQKKDSSNHITFTKGSKPRKYKHTMKPEHNVTYSMCNLEDNCTSEHFIAKNNLVKRRYQRKVLINGNEKNACLSRSVGCQVDLTENISQMKMNDHIQVMPLLDSSEDIVNSKTAKIIPLNNSKNVSTSAEIEPVNPVLFSASDGHSPDATVNSVDLQKHSIGVITVSNSDHVHMPNTLKDLSVSSTSTGVTNAVKVPNEIFANENKFSRAKEPVCHTRILRNERKSNCNITSEIKSNVCPQKYKKKRTATGCRTSKFGNSVLKKNKPTLTPRKQTTKTDIRESPRKSKTVKKQLMRSFMNEVVCKKLNACTLADVKKNTQHPTSTRNPSTENELKSTGGENLDFVEIENRKQPLMHDNDINVEEILMRCHNMLVNTVSCFDPIVRDTMPSQPPSNSSTVTDEELKCNNGDNVSIDNHPSSLSSQDSEERQLCIDVPSDDDAISLCASSIGSISPRRKSVIVSDPQETTPNERKAIQTANGAPSVPKDGNEKNIHPTLSSKSLDNNRDENNADTSNTVQTSAVATIEHCSVLSGICLQFANTDACDQSSCRYEIHNSSFHLKGTIQDRLSKVNKVETEKAYRAIRHLSKICNNWLRLFINHSANIEFTDLVLRIALDACNSSFGFKTDAIRDCVFAISEKTLPVWKFSSILLTNVSSNRKLADVLLASCARSSYQSMSWLITRLTLILQHDGKQVECDTLNDILKRLTSQHRIPMSQYKNFYEVFFENVSDAYLRSIDRNALKFFMNKLKIAEKNYYAKLVSKINALRYDEASHSRVQENVSSSTHFNLNQSQLIGNLNFPPVVGNIHQQNFDNQLNMVYSRFYDTRQVPLLNYNTPLSIPTHNGQQVFMNHFNNASSNLHPPRIFPPGGYYQLLNGGWIGNPPNIRPWR